MVERFFPQDGTIFSPWRTIYYQASFPLTIGRLNEKYGVCKEKVKTEVNKRGFFSF